MIIDRYKFSCIGRPSNITQSSILANFLWEEEEGLRGNILNFYIINIFSGLKQISFGSVLILHAYKIKGRAILGEGLESFVVLIFASL